MTFPSGRSLLPNIRMITKSTGGSHHSLFLTSQSMAALTGTVQTQGRDRGDLPRSKSGAGAGDQDASHGGGVDGTGAQL